MKQWSMKFSLLLLLGSVLLFPSFCLANIPLSERDALIALYNSTNGPSWTNNSGWLGAPGTENTWYGVTTDPDNTRVIILGLQLNNLSGSIPPEIGDLGSLQMLYLGGNHIGGSIPAEIGNLDDLWHLEISSNSLVGSIPKELGNLTNLLYLWLYSNNLTGNIPSELCSLPQLRYIYVGHNQLSGNLPLELFTLTNLQRLHLDQNNFSGTIPAAVQNLTALESLGLSNNNFSGTIPAEIGNMPNLSFIYLNGNNLTGVIPQEIGDLHNLIGLHLYGNQLSGNIPSSMMNLDNLQLGNLDLRWNSLYSTDSLLIDFLNSKQYDGDWQSTQTVAPTGIYAEPLTDNSINVRWEPILYTGDSGGYEIFYSSTAGGPYSLYGFTSDKTTDHMVIEGLQYLQHYCFVIKAFTNANSWNKNLVRSEYSLEACSYALSCPEILVSPISLPGGIQGISYSQTIVSAGGIPPYLYSIIWGNLPPGLTIDTTGLISGTATNAGNYYFELSSTDSLGCKAYQYYSLDIFTSPSAPVIGAISDDDPCDQSGIMISFSSGYPSTRHDLYRDGIIADAYISSPLYYNPGDSALHSYFVRAIDGYDWLFSDSSIVQFADINNAPSQPTITSITDPNIFTFGLVIKYTPGSPAERHDLYKNGVLAKENFLSGSVFNPFDSLSHDYQIVAVNGTCVNFSYPVTATDRGSRFKPRPRIPIGELPFPHK